MPRPKNKEELLHLSTSNYEKLINRVKEMDSENIEFPEGYLNRNVRDVLGHLHEWHNMMLMWYKVGMSGEKPSMPKEGFTWKTTSLLNREIQEMYHTYDLDEVMKLLSSSHKKVYKLIESHSDEELFTKKYYKWTGSTSLGAYLISSTSSHYDWALKLIKKCTKHQLV